MMYIININQLIKKYMTKFFIVAVTLMIAFIVVDVFAINVIEIENGVVEFFIK